LKRPYYLGKGSVACVEENLQKAIYELYNTFNEYNMNIFTLETKIIPFRGKEAIRVQIIFDNKIFEISSFCLLRLQYKHEKDYDVNIKLTRFQQFCTTVMDTLLRKYQKRTLLKFYAVIATPMLLYGPAILDVNEKNGDDRNAFPQSGRRKQNDRS
jgi:hypothetical protein